MDDSKAIESVQIAITASMVIGTAVGAIVLRLAVWLANTVQFGERPASRVPVPHIATALLIMFAGSCVTAVVGVAIGLASAIALSAMGVEDRSTFFKVAVPIATVVNLSLLAVVFKLFLPATAGRAIVVLLWFLAVLVAVGAIAGAIVIALM